MHIHIPFHWTLRTHAGSRPWLFNPAFRALNAGERLTARDTGLVVEGFPRSGNSFSVFAFLNAGAGKMTVAHHVHSPSQIVSAARYGIPAILLIRAPRDAVAAGLAKIATHTASDLLRAYSVYYSTLRPLRDHYVIAPFETVTTDFGRIAAAVNRRFGTGFEEFDQNRHRMLSKAFLAQEKLEAAAHPPVKERPPRFERYARLVERAEQHHAAFLALAEDDGTA